MNRSQNEVSRNGTDRSAEETLRVLASLPAPDGLVDRVQTRLRTAPRTGSVLNWPMAVGPSGWVYSSAFRGAAAAAIVCVVAGGGWRIYSRVQPAASARILLMPAAGPSSPLRGFSIGGSVHTPDPRTGPVLTGPMLPDPVLPDPVPTHQVVKETPEAITNAPLVGQPSAAARAKKPGNGRKANASQPTSSQQ